mmetsp:Transcript_10911/g.14631  ORF Transcript_10911/g.14631 Transcript_10911/m.14631 type:complete len:214 (-) Transcript_10911:546-1187(-)
MFNDFSVVQRSVNTKILRYFREILIKVLVFSVSHEFSWHYNLALHHVSKNLEQTIWITLQNLSTESLVSFLVACFVPCNPCADLCQVLVSSFTRKFSYVAMRYFGRTLLEGSVNKSSVRVLLSTRVEAAGDEVLNGDLNTSHVTPTTKVKVLIQEITVSVLLRGPTPAPTGPWRFCGACGVITTLESIQKCLICGKCFFSYHISDKDYKHIIW